MRNKIIIILLLLTACSTKMVIDTKEAIPFDCKPYPAVTALQLKDYEPILDPELFAGEGGWKLSLEDNKRVVDNQADFIRYMKEMNVLVTYLKECIEKAEGTINDLNKPSEVVEEKAWWEFWKV